MDRGQMRSEPCCGAYDARYIQNVVRFLQLKSGGMEGPERAALLARASRLPGLCGRFVERDGVLVFQPVGMVGHP